MTILYCLLLRTIQFIGLTYMYIQEIYTSLISHKVNTVKAVQDRVPITHFYL